MDSEKDKIIKLYEKCSDKHCVECKQYVGRDELYDIVLTQTKRKNIVIVHKKCIGINIL